MPAFVIGHGNSVITHCSDDGEPSGTAGRPALAVLQGSGFGDAAVVVTRYFGGTLLGTGGLVKAYGDAVREVLKLVRRAVKVPTTTIGVQLPYALFEQVQRLAAAPPASSWRANSLADVTLVMRFRDEQLDAFLKQLLEQPKRRANQPVVLDTQPGDHFPAGLSRATFATSNRTLHPFTKINTGFDEVAAAWKLCAGSVTHFRKINSNAVECCRAGGKGLPGPAGRHACQFR